MFQLHDKSNMFVRSGEVRDKKVGLVKGKVRFVVKSEEGRPVEQHIIPKILRGTLS